MGLSEEKDEVEVVVGGIGLGKGGSGYISSTTPSSSVKVSSVKGKKVTLQHRRHRHHRLFWQLFIFQTRGKSQELHSDKRNMSNPVKCSWIKC